MTARCGKQMPFKDLAWHNAHECPYRDIQYKPSARDEMLSLVDRPDSLTASRSYL